MTWIRRFILIIVLAVSLLSPSVASATFAGQNGQIAFGKDNEVWAIRPNGDRPQLLSDRAASSVMWSPNGRQIAFVDSRSNRTTRLHIKDIATGSVQHITRQASISDSEPAWSYDGSHIAFVRTKQDSDGRSALFTIRADGSELKNISGWSQNKTYAVPSWSPDNKRLAYQETDQNNARILIKELGNGKTRELVALSDISQRPLLAWSPNGKKLLFNDSDGQVYTIWADGTHRAVISDGDSYGASWSPEGDRIAFLEDFSGESISISEADGTVRYIPLGLTKYSRVGAPIWSPNGKRLVFVATQTLSGKKDLFSLMVSDAARPIRIAVDVADTFAWQSVAE